VALASIAQSRYWHSNLLVCRGLPSALPGEGWMEFLFCGGGVKQQHRHATREPTKLVGGFLFLLLAVRVLVACCGDGAGEDGAGLRTPPSWKSIFAYRALLEDAPLDDAVLVTGGAHLEMSKTFLCAKNPDFSCRLFIRDASCML
jgi:hypothetical protein